MNKVSRLKTLLLTSIATVGSAVMAQAQTSPLTDMTTAAVDQVELILPALSPLFLAALTLTIGFVVFKKVRKGVNSA